MHKNGNLLEQLDLLSCTSKQPWASPCTQDSSLLPHRHPELTCNLEPTPANISQTSADLQKHAWEKRDFLARSHWALQWLACGIIANIAYWDKIWILNLPNDLKKEGTKFCLDSSLIISLRLIPKCHEATPPSMIYDMSFHLLGISQM